MKVYLDDERETPEGWVRCYWPDEVIAILKQGSVTHLSLDHDLGDDGRGTGYHVLTWLEEAIATNPDFDAPRYIIAHTANPSAKVKMNAAIRSIYRLLESRNQ